MKLDKSFQVLIFLHYTNTNNKHDHEKKYCLTYMYYFKCIYIYKYNHGAKYTKCRVYEMIHSSKI